MPANKRISIAIADTSVIIRNGIISVLKRLSVLNIDIVEIADMSQLGMQLFKFKPNVLIVNPLSLGRFSLQQLKTDSGHKSMKFIALQTSLTDSATLNAYDETISLYDSAEQIKDKLTRFYMLDDDSADGRQELSIREKEIIVCVVKGMTNRQMAEHLCLSTHTVITHRRNIANKLQIHSPAGLTIYAIVNKLVEIDDVKDTIQPED
ncbi:MAG: LuxR C-terminal-related transcriptional regulator [Tannerella sp.]|jgi:DNA-binding NarL/FixJ family response regulator|nr:LuxR C-terminal-related transcriptional regulator [Tannerella sp.]